jgi:hypothetical protein
METVKELLYCNGLGKKKYAGDKAATSRSA